MWKIESVLKCTLELSMHNFKVVTFQLSNETGDETEEQCLEALKLKTKRANEQQEQEKNEKHYS